MTTLPFFSALASNCRDRLNAPCTVAPLAGCSRIKPSPGIERLCRACRNIVRRKRRNCWEPVYEHLRAAAEMQDTAAQPKDSSRLRRAFGPGTRVSQSDTDASHSALALKRIARAGLRVDSHSQPEPFCGPASFSPWRPWHGAQPLKLAPCTRRAADRRPRRRVAPSGARNHPRGAPNVPGSGALSMDLRITGASTGGKLARK